MHSQIQIRRIGFMLSILAGLALGACNSGPRPAQDGRWQSQMSRLRIAVRGDEADPSKTAGWGGFRQHIHDFTGLDPQTSEASDYNGVIQALSTGQVDYATMGGGSYANVDAQIGTKAVPFLTVRQAEGSTGYYSMMMVRSSSPYRTLADLKGKKIAFVDFNSTSGYIFPRRAMHNQGIDPDQFFGEAVMAGGATQAAMALVNGRVEAAVMLASAGTPETGFAASTPITLARKGLMNVSDLRSVWTAGPIPNSPYVIRTDRPKPFIDVMRGTLAILPYEKPQVWEEISQTAGSTFAPVNREFYKEVIDIRSYEINSRRGEGARQ
jgi:phosphonate transport system substrate-binding protein